MMAKIHVISFVSKEMDKDFTFAQKQRQHLSWGYLASSIVREGNIVS